MTIKIIPPDDDRKELFEQLVKPLLVAAEENNAVDKWMFNLTEGGEVNKNSVVFVSTHYKKIFIIKGIYETKQPPPLKNRTDYIIHGLPRKVRVQRSNGTWKEEPETWSAHLGHWHLHNSRYIGGSSVVHGTGKIPNLGELSSDIDFDFWSQSIDKKRSYQPYQQISSKWKMNEEE